MIENIVSLISKALYSYILIILIIMCGLYLFASEIVSSIYFIIEIGGQIYLEEILYMLMIYAVYGMVFPAIIFSNYRIFFQCTSQVSVQKKIDIFPPRVQ